MPLLTFPLFNVSKSPSELYSQAFLQLLEYIFSIELLPNRLPLSSLSSLSANVPFSSISVISPFIPSLVTTLSIESRINLVANCVLFIPPRYAKLPATALATYLYLLTELMNAIPTYALESSSRKNSHTNPRRTFYSDCESDSESDKLHVVVVDNRTLKRLETLTLASHINALTGAAQHHTSTLRPLFTFLLALSTAWPSRADAVLSAVVVASGGGLIHELYRGFVRSSPLGQDESFYSLISALNCFLPWRRMFSLVLCKIRRTHLHGHHCCSWPTLIRRRF